MNSRSMNLLYSSAIVLAALIHVGNAQPTWTWQNPLPHGNTLIGIHVVHPSTFVAFSSCGTMLRSTDKGFTWNLESSYPMGIDIFSFINDSVGWAAGIDLRTSVPQIAKTTDGGRSWSAIYELHGSANNREFLERSMFFVDVQTGWYVTLGGHIYKSTTGGTSWDLMFKDTTITMHKITFRDPLNGWVAGGDEDSKPVVLRTSDGGFSWNAVRANSADGLDRGYFNTVHFLNRDTGWAAGTPRSVFRTTDGGVTWIPGTTSTLSGKYDVDFTTPTSGAAVAMGGKILRTTDGGLTWPAVQSWSGLWSQDANLYSVKFLDSAIGVATGGGSLVFQTTDGGASWTRRTNQNLIGWTQVYFLNSDNGWVIGKDNDSGMTKPVLMKTTNGGSYWQRIPLDFSGQSMTFIDKDKGWIGGLSRNLLMSTDGGLSWVEQLKGLKGYIRAIQFVDNTTGWAVGDSGTIYKTENGGQTWTDQSISPDHSLLGCSFVSSQRGWIGAEFGKILMTSDGGTTWTVHATPYSSELYALSFVDTSVGWIVGAKGLIYRTLDGGKSWTLQQSGTSYDLRCASFLNRNIGFAFGFVGRMLKTTNGGTTWTLMARQTYNYLRGCFFINENDGWVVGDQGTILRTAVGGGSSFEIETSVKTGIDRPATTALCHNYPNPFNPTTTIRYYIPGRSRVNIVIFDILGRNVGELVSGVREAGTYEVRWDASAFSSGLYFCRMLVVDVSATVAAPQIATTRMVLLR